jgi:hypothetical protein
MRCVAHVSLQYNCLPTELDLEQIEDYLLIFKKKGASEADFKLTVYGLRFLFRWESVSALQRIGCPNATCWSLSNS